MYINIKLRGSNTFQVTRNITYFDLWRAGYIISPYLWKNKRFNKKPLLQGQIKEREPLKTIWATKNERKTLIWLMSWFISYYVKIYTSWILATRLLREDMLCQDKKQYHENRDSFVCLDYKLSHKYIMRVNLLQRLY